MGMEVGMRKHKPTHFQTDLPKGRGLNYPVFRVWQKMLTPLLESVSMSLVFGYVQL